MKKINHTLLPLVSLVLVLSGCQKIIEPKDLPQQDARLVLNCVMENDSVITMNVSSSKSIISGKDYKYLDNATCVLYENDQVMEQLTNFKGGNYKSKLIPKINRKYSLKVSAAGFETAEGSTIMPDSVAQPRSERYDLANSNYFIMSYGNIRQAIYGTTKCKLWIKDNLSVKNYYSIRAKAMLFDSADNFLDLNVGCYLNNNSSSANSDGYSSGLSIETTDETLVNGSEIPLDFDISISSANASAAYAEVYITISNTSEDLYKYNTTLRNQVNTGVSLFAEPVLVFNNIKNGMGIVGSMHSTTYFLYKAAITKQ